MIFTSLDPFFNNTSLIIGLKKFVSKSFIWLYLFLATQLVVLFLYLIILNGGYLVPTGWQSVLELISQSLISLKEKLNIIKNIFFDLTEFKLELSPHLIKAASAELFSVAGLVGFLLINLFFGAKESRQSTEKHQPWVREIISCLLCTVILLTTNPLTQHIIRKKAAVLISPFALEQMVLFSLLLSGILMIYLLYQFKEWFVYKFGDTIFQLVMILLGIVFIIYIMHSKVYPGLFTIWQMGCIVMGSVLAFSISFYFYKAKKRFDVEVIPLIIRGTYTAVSLGRVVPFLILSYQHETPVFLFVLLYLVEAITSLVSILVGWAMVDISLPEFKFKFYSLKNLFEKIKYMCWDYKYLLVCQGDLEISENPVRPVEAITITTMERGPQENLTTANCGPEWRGDLSKTAKADVRLVTRLLTVPFKDISISNPDSLLSNKSSMVPFGFNLKSPWSQPNLSLLELGKGRVLVCWGHLNFKFEPTGFSPMSFDEDGKLLFPTKGPQKSVCPYTVAIDSESSVIGYQALSAPKTTMPLLRGLDYEEGLPTTLQSLVQYYHSQRQLKLSLETFYCYHEKPEIYKYLTTPQKGPLRGSQILPRVLRLNNDICIHRGLLALLCKSSRPRGEDLFFDGHKYVPVCHVEEYSRYHTTEQTVWLNGDLFHSVPNNASLPEGSKVISICGKLHSSSSQPPHYALPSPEGVAVRPGEEKLMVDFIADDWENLPHLNSDSKVVTYKPSGQENLSKLKEIAKKSGGRVVSCWGWNYGMERYNVATNFLGRAVACQPAMSSMPLNFPFGPPILNSPFLSMLYRSSARFAANLPFDVNQHFFDNADIAKASSMKFDPVHRVGNLVYMRMETLLNIHTTNEAAISFQGGIYNRVCTCDYYSFLKQHRLWINDLKLIRSWNCSPPAAKNGITISNVVWRQPSS